MNWMSFAMRGFVTSLMTKLCTIGCTPHTIPRANSTANWSGYLAICFSTSGRSVHFPHSGSQPGMPPGVAKEPKIAQAPRYITVTAGTGSLSGITPSPFRSQLE